MAGQAIFMDRPGEITEGSYVVVPVHKAVKDLRAHLGESQQQFAFTIGISIRGLANYEAGRVPNPKALISLARVASGVRRPDLVGVFMRALGDELGLFQEEDDYHELTMIYMESFFSTLQQYLAGDLETSAAAERRLNAFCAAWRPTMPRRLSESPKQKKEKTK
jgi:transcriptional regulator with XRE-family HTH domain